MFGLPNPFAGAAGAVSGAFGGSKPQGGSGLFNTLMQKHGAPQGPPPQGGASIGGGPSQGQPQMQPPPMQQMPQAPMQPMPGMDQGALGGGQFLKGDNPAPPVGDAGQGAVGGDQYGQAGEQEPPNPELMQQMLLRMGIGGGKQY